MCCIVTLWQAQTERNVRFPDISQRKGFFYVYTSRWWNNADLFFLLHLNLWILGKYIVENQISLNLFLSSSYCYLKFSKYWIDLKFRNYSRILQIHCLWCSPSYSAYLIHQIHHSNKHLIRNLPFVSHYCMLHVFFAFSTIKEEFPNLRVSAHSLFLLH